MLLSSAIQRHASQDAQEQEKVQRLADEIKKSIQVDSSHH